MQARHAEQYETTLSTLLNSTCLKHLVLQCSQCRLVPLLASGAFTDNARPRQWYSTIHSHYSMNHIKASCADETDVTTAPHNDICFIEDLCKTRKHVAYIADGIYSMGGQADIDSLLYLKSRYGLFLYLDDSHALSAFGEKGEDSSDHTFNR